jgi:hypothetical protein
MPLTDKGKHSYCGVQILWIYAYPRFIPSMKRYYPKENEKCDQTHHKKSNYMLVLQDSCSMHGLENSVRYDGTTIIFQEYWKRIT